MEKQEATHSDCIQYLNYNSFFRILNKFQLTCLKANCDVNELFQKTNNQELASNYQGIPQFLDSNNCSSFSHGEIFSKHSIIHDNCTREASISSYDRVMMATLDNGMSDDPIYLFPHVLSPSHWLSGVQGEWLQSLLCTAASYASYPRTHCRHHWLPATAANIC